jgi:hypothetical protein
MPVTNPALPTPNTDSNRSQQEAVHGPPRWGVSKYRFAVLSALGIPIIDVGQAVRATNLGDPLQFFPVRYDQ